MNPETNVDKQQYGKDFMEDFLRGYGFAQDLQAQDPAAPPLGHEAPVRFGLMGPFVDTLPGDAGPGAASSPASRLEGVIGLSTKNAQNLHESANSGDKKAQTLLQNLNKGRLLKKEGESGYGWWRDTKTFRMPIREGKLREATDYIYEEMIRNLTSPTLESIRRRNAKGGLKGTGGSLYSFGNKVRGGGPWDHKRTLRFGRPNDGQVHLFKGTPAEWFHSAEEDAKYFYDVFSNVHYGYVGAAAGYPVDVLLDAAGVVQKRSESGKERVRKFRESHAVPNDDHLAYLAIDWGDRGWDPPTDQAAVRLGIHLYQNYGADLQKNDLEFELRHWPGIYKTTRTP